jgi:hypothetical protein
MIPEHLPPLFWDVNIDAFDPASCPAHAIGRVLELGGEQAVAWMERSFSREQIAAVIRSERRLSRRSATYWSLVYGIKPEDVAALG